MEELAPGLQVVPGRPAWAVNVYVAGGVLIDAATPFARRRILRGLRGVRPHAHAITHAHVDHYGSSHALCTALGIPFWVPAGDARFVAERTSPPEHGLAGVIAARLPMPAPHPIDRELHEGNEVGGFTVLETPGHSPGHVSYWREADRVLIVGDTLFGQDMRGRPGLTEPPAFIGDRTRNRASIRRLAALEPALAVFGHGPPLRDPAALAAFAAAL
jgi:glyoxylase-like metal-dependent hydrolase (beta-lactamase superfamily II)